MVFLWLVPTILAILFLSGFILWLATNGGLGFPWVAFYVKGKEVRFKLSEIHILRKAAVGAKMPNPVSIFSSVKTLDSTVRTLITDFRARQKMDDPATNVFLTELFEFRKKVGFNPTHFTKGIKTSRELMGGQRIRMTLTGDASFQSTVVETQRKYIAVAYPLGKELPPGFSWKNQKVKVYFWREEDAGYYFESKVLEDFQDLEIPALHLAHSDNLVRSQKRTSIRLDCDLPCSIYNLATIDLATEALETSSGYRGRLVNLSEDGCSLLVGGKAKVGLAMKVQAELSGHLVTMSGIIKGITYDKKKNRSVLHLQASPLSDRTRNDILTYVYDIFEERSDKPPKKYSSLES